MVNMLKGPKEKMVKIQEMMDNTDEKQGIPTEIQGKKRKIKQISTTEENVKFRSLGQTYYQAGQNRK